MKTKKNNIFNNKLSNKIYKQFIKGGAMKTQSVSTGKIDDDMFYLEEGGETQFILHNVREDSIQLNVEEAPFESPKLIITAGDNKHKIIKYDRRNKDGEIVNPEKDFEIKYEIIETDETHNPKRLKVTITYKERKKIHFQPKSIKDSIKEETEKEEKKKAKAEAEAEKAKAEAEAEAAKAKAEAEAAKAKAKAERKKKLHQERIELEKQRQQHKDEFEKEKQQHKKLKEEIIKKQHEDSKLFKKKFEETIKKQDKDYKLFEQIKDVGKQSLSDMVDSNQKKDIRTHHLHGKSPSYITTATSNTVPRNVTRENSTPKHPSSNRFHLPPVEFTQIEPNTKIDGGITWNDILATTNNTATTPPPPPPPSFNTTTTNRPSPSRHPPATATSTAISPPPHIPTQDSTPGRKKISRDVFDQKVEAITFTQPGISKEMAKQRVKTELQEQGLWYGDKVGGPGGKFYKTGGKSKKKQKNVKYNKTKRI